jgi:site-specific recombinase XerD
MHSKVHKVKDFIYEGTKFDVLYLITDDQGVPPIIPLLYTTHLSRFGVTYESFEATEELTQRRMRCLSQREVSDSTIRAYVHNLSKFLNYLEICKKNYGTPGLHSSTVCSEKFVNHYLNEVLPLQINSQNSLQVNVSSLSAYFNWLDYFEITPRLNLKIFRKTRQHIAEKSSIEIYIKYVSNYYRIQLLNDCKTLCEKLMMRMGYEVGLRTSEVASLRLAGKGKLLNLFEKLKNPELNHIEQFSYYLEGRFTKGGKSRWIYFDRELLQDMDRYYDNERNWLIQKTRNSSDVFFLRSDHGFAGTGIGVEQASRVFRKRAGSAGLNPSLSFHDLRHTFATQLYHDLLLDSDGRETRSESAALITVAQRLGHAFTKNGHAPATTTRYIRMSIQMLEIEKDEI